VCRLAATSALTWAYADLLSYSLALSLFPEAAADGATEHVPCGADGVVPCLLMNRLFGGPV
jgi:hypothetical protein